MNSSPANMQAAASAPAVGKPRVMMVDDSEVVLEMGRIALEEAGYEVFTLDNPLTVAHALRKNVPDLLLIDVNMPALTGDVVTKIVANHGAGKKIPVLLYSDISVQELEERAKACGATGFIQKTSDEAKFLSQVAHWLEQTKG
jgi:CheY-like chemotaxis protein